MSQSTLARTPRPLPVGILRDGDPLRFFECAWSEGASGIIHQPGADPRIILAGTLQAQRLVLVRTDGDRRIDWRLFWRSGNKGPWGWLTCSDYRQMVRGIAPRLQASSTTLPGDALESELWTKQLLVVLADHGII